MSLKIAKEALGAPDADVVDRDGKVVGGMWIGPRARHDYADHVAARERGEPCKCLECELGGPPKKTA